MNRGEGGASAMLLSSLKLNETGIAMTCLRQALENTIQHTMHECFREQLNMMAVSYFSTMLPIGVAQ